MTVQTKRAYDPPSLEDGYRVLVDRLWPRGVARERLRLDAWLKDLAPSDELRHWFGHNPARWGEFRDRYRRELQGSQQQALLRALAERAATGALTLVYAARDSQHNNAVALKEVIEEMTAQEGQQPSP